MRSDEIREMGPDDIKARVAALEEERFRLRFRSASEPLENPLRLRTIRKDIARLKTILTQKQRGEEITPRPATKAPAKAKTDKKRVKNG